MKHLKEILSIAALVLSGACFTLAQPTAFTYQGKLEDGGPPANGSYDLRFAIYDGAGGGTLLAGPQTNRAVAISHGQFTVTLDFGDGVFNGADRWLEIGVRSNGSAFAFTTLSPRQPLTPTPYALYAPHAGEATTARATLSGVVSNLSLAADAVTTDKIADGTLEPQDFHSESFGTILWQTHGNSGTTPGEHFLGTTDHQPLEIKVDNERALRFELGSSNSVNITGGWLGNSVSPSVAGATIAGGGAGVYFDTAFSNRVEGDFGSIGGGGNNVIAGGAAGATVGGGVGGLIEVDARRATISGGGGNVIRSAARYATVGGGQQNEIATNAAWATVGGGFINEIRSNAACSTIAGGTYNMIWDNAEYATIPGGQYNRATNYAFAAGHRAWANHTGSFVWADSTDANFASTANDQFSIRASGGVRLSDDTPALSFGATARQMINLYDDRYAIGIQSGTVYQRTATRFSWFRGGMHSDVQNDPGTGGSVLMTLTSSGLTVNGAFVSASDRNTKEDFEPVNSSEVLEKVVALPLSCWSYKTDEERSRHVGPMAQDFRAAFGLGTDDKHIATVDADGVALAAIQGLDQKVESGRQEAETQIEALKAENAELKARLERLERLLVVEE